MINKSDEDTIVYVNGNFVKKSLACISVYDSGFMHGDGVYEGIRVYQGKVFMLEEHIKRLFESAKTINIDIGISREEMKRIVLETIRVNKIKDDIHIRLMVTRGKKIVSGMNPKYNIGGASIVVLYDYKPPIYNKSGVKLITSTLRRATPYFLDPKIHSMNQLNQIMASIEANRQGANEAIMLDINGFVAETNGTTIFMVMDGIFLTPTIDYILVGITRKYLIELAKEKGYKVIERNISISEFYNADEVFICGTVGEVVPVSEIDGKKIGERVPGKYTKWLMYEHKKMTSKLGTPAE
ncbi:Branched-chain-amino-acid aminotransferase [subsurface metagenome]